MTVENGGKTTDHLRVPILRRLLETGVVEKSATLGYPALNSQPCLGRVFEKCYARPDARLNVGDPTSDLKDFSIPFNLDPPFNSFHADHCEGRWQEGRSRPVVYSER